MHNYLKIYYFINKFNSDEIEKLDKNISLIYRNYKNQPDLELIKKIRDICFKQKRRFFISNQIKIAINFKLDGVYIPSFNNLTNFKNLKTPKDFIIIGSAHNKAQLINKKRQGCKEVFISPIFKTKKTNSFLGISRFNLISNHSEIDVVALGGINASNYCKLRLANCVGFAAIRWIKKTGLK